MDVFPFRYYGNDWLMHLALLSACHSRGRNVVAKRLWFIPAWLSVAEPSSCRLQNHTHQCVWQETHTRLCDFISVIYNMGYTSLHYFNDMLRQQNIAVSLLKRWIIGVIHTLQRQLLDSIFSYYPPYTSVRPSCSWTMSKQINISSIFFQHHSSFSVPNVIAIFRRGPH